MFLLLLGKPDTSFNYTYDGIVCERFRISLRIRHINLMGGETHIFLPVIFIDFSFPFRYFVCETLLRPWTRT